MIQSPRNIKYRKYQKNYIDKQDTPAKRSTQLNFGSYGLQCNENRFIKKNKANE